MRSIVAKVLLFAFLGSGLNVVIVVQCVRMGRTTPRSATAGDSVFVALDSPAVQEYVAWWQENAAFQDWRLVTIQRASCTGLEELWLNEGVAILMRSGWPVKSFAGELWLWGNNGPSSAGMHFTASAAYFPSRPIWRGFVANTFILGVLLWFAVALPGTVRRLLRRSRALCPACAYPMGVSEVCTECGARLPRAPTPSNHSLQLPGRPSRSGT